MSGAVARARGDAALFDDVPGFLVAQVHENAVHAKVADEQLVGARAKCGLMRVWRFLPVGHGHACAPVRDQLLAGENVSLDDGEHADAAGHVVCCVQMPLVLAQADVAGIRAAARLKAQRLQMPVLHAVARRRALLLFAGEGGGVQRCAVLRQGQIAGVRNGGAGVQQFKPPVFGAYDGRARPAQMGVGSNVQKHDGSSPDVLFVCRGIFAGKRRVPLQNRSAPLCQIGAERFFYMRAGTCRGKFAETVYTPDYIISAP